MFGCANYGVTRVISSQAPESNNFYTRYFSPIIPSVFIKIKSGPVQTTHYYSVFGISAISWDAASFACQIVFMIRLRCLYCKRRALVRVWLRRGLRETNGDIYTDDACLDTFDWIFTSSWISNLQKGNRLHKL